MKTGNKETKQYALIFSMDAFNKKWREVLPKYFNGEIPAIELAARLGVTREFWDRTMAGLFSLAVYKHDMVEIKEIPPGSILTFLRPKK